MILLRPTSARITQNYGENPQLYPGTAGHMGIDYGTALGTPIMAAADGVVVFAGLDHETQINPAAGYGIYVKLAHTNGGFTIYGHLDSVSVQVSEVVRMGQVIGVSGNTGRSTAPHLHFEYRVDATRAIDPAPYIVDKIPRNLFRVRITQEGDGLRIRTGPSKSRGVVRSLKPGDEMVIMDIGGTDVWLRVEDGWIMYRPEWVESV